MPLGAARIALLAKTQVTAVAEVIRYKVGVSALGNAQIDTAQSKFGVSSALFDGTEDWLQIDNNPIPSSGDFTVEFWFRPSAIGSLRPIWSNRATGGTHRGTLYINAAGGITWWNASSNLNATNFGNLSANTWYHIACVIDGTVGRIFINGTMNSATFGWIRGDILEIGAAKYSGTVFGDEVIGHIDEFRISDTARYTTGFTPSTTPFTNDENTTLLLHCDGADASTYFEDDNSTPGTRNTLITIGNNAQVDTAQKKFGGASILFDGTDDAIRFTTDSNYMATPYYTGAWTMEFWFYMPSNPGATAVLPLVNRLGGGFGSREFMVLIENLNIRFAYNTYNGTDPIQSINLNGSGSFATSTWHHYAIGYNGTTGYSVWLNGTRHNTITTTYSNHQLLSTAFQLGGYGSVTAPGNDFPGSIDEFRVSTTDRYGVGNSSITVPTAPFSNDANTVVLCHFDGSDGNQVFHDDNGPGRALNTVNTYGNAQIDTAQYKFGGSSALFDGTGDYLQVVGDGAITLGEDNWTVEAWYKISTQDTDMYLISFLGGPATHWGINIYQGQWRAGVINSNIVGGYPSGITTGIDTTTWHHIALVRDSSTNLTLYIDGTSVGTRTLTGTFNFTSTALYLSAYSVSPTYNGEWNGWIDEVRVSNTARYTGSFTPSTTQFQNDDNTLLLLHMDGTDGSTYFKDDNGARSKVGVSAVSDAKISTTQSKFGGASLALDYTSSSWDYLEIVEPSSLLNFGTGDWTVEGWFRFNNTNTDAALWTGGTTTGDLDIRRTNDNKLRIGRVNTAWDLTSGTTGITANTWHHIAFVKSSGTAYIFVDGTSVGSASNSINYSMNTQARIGAQTTSSLGFGGYIDEIRISNIARYTSGFTPSTTPFQNDDNTLLLLHMDGTDGSTVFIDDNGVPPNHSY